MRLNLDDLDRACEDLSIDGVKLSETFEGFFKGLLGIRTRVSRLRNDVESAASSTLEAEVETLTVALDRLVAATENTDDAVLAATAVQQFHDSLSADDSGPWLTKMTTGLNKVAALPMTRLVNSAQMRDSLEQRLSHIKLGFSLLYDAPEVGQPCMAMMLGAQTKSVADTVVEISESSRQSCELLEKSVKDAKALIPVDAPSAADACKEFAETMGAILQRAISDDVSTAASKAKSAATELAERNIPGKEALVAAEAMKALDSMATDIAGMKSRITELSDHAAGIDAAATTMRRDSPAGETVPAELVAGLQTLYTSDVEHEVHRVELLRSSPG